MFVLCVDKYIVHYNKIMSYDNQPSVITTHTTCGAFSLKRDWCSKRFPSICKGSFVWDLIEGNAISEIRNRNYCRQFSIELPTVCEWLDRLRIYLFNLWIRWRFLDFPANLRSSFLLVCIDVRIWLIFSRGGFNLVISLDETIT